MRIIEYFAIFLFFLSFFAFYASAYEFWKGELREGFYMLGLHFSLLVLGGFFALGSSEEEEKEKEGSVFDRFLGLIGLVLLISIPVSSALFMGLFAYFTIHGHECLHTSKEALCGGRTCEECLHVGGAFFLLWLISVSYLVVMTKALEKLQGRQI